MKRVSLVSTTLALKQILSDKQHIHFKRNLHTLFHKMRIKQRYSSKVDHCDPNPNSCCLCGVCFFGILVFVCRQLFVILSISSDDRQSAAILDGPSISKTERERERDYYNCSKIDTLPIVREIGRGKQKTVF